MNIRPEKLHEWMVREASLMSSLRPEESEIIKAAKDIASLAAFFVTGRKKADYDVLSDYIIKLLRGIPLTPIEDIDCEWKLTMRSSSNLESYYSIRFPNLAKIVMGDSILYLDDTRVTCVDINNPNNRFFSPFVSRLVHKEICPIELPYSPGEEKLIAFVEQFNYDEQINPEVYDTLAVLWIIKSGEDTMLRVNRQFKLVNGLSFDIMAYEEIGLGEYTDRRRKVIDELDG